MSHSADLVLLGVERCRELGVDIEVIDASRASTDVADRFFAPPEAAALRARPADAQCRAFFDYWTLKEAYLKARGMGLSIALDSFSFTIAASGDIDFARRLPPTFPLVAEEVVDCPIVGASRERPEESSGVAEP